MKKTIYSISLPLVLCALFLLAGNLSWAAEKGFRLPEYEKMVIENGLTVYLMEQHEVPLIYVNLLTPAGAVKDGKRNGLANLTADALLYGTEKLTKAQLEEQMDSLGVQYGSGAGLEAAFLVATFAAEDQDRLLAILADIITRPRFDAEVFAKRKKQILLQLEQLKERPSRLRLLYLHKLLYGNHPYGNPRRGTRAAVRGLSIDDVKSFYQSQYKPADSAIAVVGDFRIADMKKKIRKLFGAWKNPGHAPKMQEKAIPGITKPRVLLVNKENATETQIMIGSFGYKQGHPDFVPVNIINTLLGGRFTSWLNDELRISAGLTYGASSYFISYKNSGVFAVRTNTPTATTEKALDLAFEVLGRLHKPGVDSKTLESAKNYEKGQFPPQYERMSSLGRALTNMFLYGYDESFVNDFEKNVDRMDREKAGKVIGQHFPAKNHQIILIGKASAIRGIAKKYGEVVEKEMSETDF